MESNENKNLLFRDEMDAKQRPIPKEYRNSFKREQFCWQGFFFTYFWAFSKGLITWGFVYFGFYLASFMLLTNMYQNNPEWDHADALVYSLLILIIPLLLPMIHCGVYGYRIYTRFLENNEQKTISKHRTAGGMIFAVLLIVTSPFWFMMFVGILFDLGGAGF